MLSQLYCIMANNTSNNNTVCDHIKTMLHQRNIYSFCTEHHRLPCLAHVVNLGLMAFMSIVTWLSTIETTMAIWDYDPTLPQNRILEGSIDVVATLRTLIIKIQSSGQHITYFERLQTQCGIKTPLKIPLHSNIHWGTADGMLARCYDLRTVRTCFYT
jgi:hypothetical protein